MKKLADRSPPFPLVQSSKSLLTSPGAAISLTPFLMARTCIKKSLVNAGVLRLASRFGPRGVAILMYHSVMDDPSSAETTLGGIVHSTTVFRGQVELIAKEFSAVSIDDVRLFLRGEKKLPARPVVVTFDDGYADNYQVANGILNSFGKSAVFYVTVDCIERQRLPWPSLLRHAFLATQKKSWTLEEGRIRPLSTTDQRLQAFARASETCSKLSGIPQDEFVKSVQQQLDVDPSSSSQLMMNWEEVRGLMRSGHVIGSHTMTHPNVAHIPESEVHSELAESKRKLENELTRPVVHFSYPCPALQPHWTEHTVTATRESGYETAVTTNGGIVRRHDDPLSLRRIRPTKTVDGLRWNLECAFLGRNV
jgi:peptidoglycan/xylan/chitin deacetylase (PgdA/CDA1 family)